MSSKFSVKHLKKILEPLEDDLEVVAECRYDDRYVLTDISTYEDENIKKHLVIELGHPYDVLVTVTGEYYDDKNNR